MTTTSSVSSPSGSSVSVPRVGIVSLGCPKALVDSERILTQLRIEGYALSPSYQDADVVIVNTCGFIDSAKQESLETIAEALNENGKVIVTGCMGANPESILEVHPNVLGVTGPQAYESVMNLVHQTIAPPAYNAFDSLVPEIGIKLTPKHYAYLKISEGCNHSCRFCIIPDLRGKLVSRPISEVMEEAQRLVKSGVQELLVISQDTSAYGSDLKYPLDFWQGQPLRTKFIDLCRGLGQLGVWIRLHYVYPYPHVDEVIPLMNEGVILPYLDIPFQHGSPRILKLMKRPAAAENTLERIQKWRAQCPDLTIRSTFIVGFPGETEEDFQELLDFLTSAEIDHAGCFKYSAVEGATANELPNPVDEEIKEERYHRFMQHQQEIAERRMQRWLDRVIDVLLDEKTEEGWIARRAGDAPEIDAEVYIPLDEITDNWQVGTIQKALVTEVGPYHLDALGVAISVKKQVLSIETQSV
ncbi:MAG: 30S ribosomal protein S12 methylthiotransferase RimO [Pseudomonadota bacterium]